VQDFDAIKLLKLSPQEPRGSHAMKSARLQDMSVEHLVERFVTIALEQDRAMEWDDNATYNRLFDQMEDVRQELKNRPGDQRRVLVSFYNHANAQVRLKVALTTLIIDPQGAREVLQIISDRNEFPQAADARWALRLLDEKASSKAPE
jgi:hypothetical protein